MPPPWRTGQQFVTMLQVELLCNQAVLLPGIHIPKGTESTQSHKSWYTNVGGGIFIAAMLHRLNVPPNFRR